MSGAPEAEGDWPCRFCGGGDVCAVYMHPREQRPLLHCGTCGGYWFPAPPESHLAAYYNGEYAETHRRQYLEQHRSEYESGQHDAILRVLQDHLEPGSQKIRMMEFGTSYAFLLKKAREIGMDVVGVEYDAEIRRYNEEKIGVRTIGPDRLDQVADGTLNIVWASHVAEHMPDPAATMRALAGKLRAGGILAVTSPCFAPALVGTDSLRITDMVYPGHLSFFTLEAAKRLLARAGLDVATAVTQFVNDGQALRHLNTPAGRGMEAGGLTRALEEAPFHAGANLFVVARRPANARAGRRDGRRCNVRVSGLSPARSVRYDVDGDWEILMPVPSRRRAKAVVCGNVIALSTPGVSTPVKIEALGRSVEIPANSGPRSFRLEGEGTCLAVRGGGEAEIVLYDCVLTEHLAPA